MLLEDELQEGEESVSCSPVVPATPYRCLSWRPRQHLPSSVKLDFCLLTKYPLSPSTLQTAGFSKCGAHGINRKTRFQRGEGTRCYSNNKLNMVPGPRAKGTSLLKAPASTTSSFSQRDATVPGPNRQQYVRVSEGGLRGNSRKG